MSDLTNVPNEQEIKRQKQLETIKYESKLHDISTHAHDGFDMEGLLMQSSTTEDGVWSLNQELDDVAIFAEIKAKQRLHSKDDDVHSAEYEMGAKAIDIMSAKESHRSLNKRKNKMEESAKRLNKASASARAIKKNYGADGNKSLRERVAATEAMYESVHSADRYFAEAVAGNKHAENVLKAKADIAYLNNLSKYYKSEVDNAASATKKEKDFIEKKYNAAQDKYNQLKKEANEKYGLSFTTRIDLAEKESISAKRDISSQEAKDLQDIKAGIEKTLVQYHNRDTANEEYLSKYGENGEESEENIKMTEKLHITEKGLAELINSGATSDIINRVSESVNEIRKSINEKTTALKKVLNTKIDLKTNVGAWGRSESKMPLLKIEWQKKNYSKTPETQEKLNAASDLYKDNIALFLLDKKYKDSMLAELGKAVKKYGNKDYLVFLKSTEKYRQYQEFAEKSLEQELKNNLMATEFETVARNFSDSDLVSSTDQDAYMDIRTYENKKKRYDLIRASIEKLKTQKNDNYNLELPKLESKFAEMEKVAFKELDDAKNWIISRYKKVKNIDRNKPVQFLVALEYIKSNIKIKDKSMQEHDDEQEIKAIQETSRNLSNTNLHVRKKGIELNLLFEKQREFLLDRYIPQGSDVLEKLKKNLTNSSGAGDGGINRSFECMFLPVFLGEDGEVLDEYKENEAFNKQLVESFTSVNLTERPVDDEKAYEQRKPMLLKVIDNINALDVDSNMFTLDYVLESKENFMKSTKIRELALSFVSIVLKDRVNKKIYEDAEKDPELKEKLERLELVENIVRPAGLVLNMDLIKNFSVSTNFQIASRPDDEEIKRVRDLNSISMEEAKKKLKEHDEEKRVVKPSLQEETNQKIQIIQKEIDQRIQNLQNIEKSAKEANKVIIKEPDVLVTARHLMMVDVNRFASMTDDELLANSGELKEAENLLKLDKNTRKLAFTDDFPGRNEIFDSKYELLGLLCQKPAILASKNKKALEDINKNIAKVKTQYEENIKKSLLEISKTNSKYKGELLSGEIIETLTPEAKEKLKLLSDPLGRIEKRVAKNEYGLNGKISPRRFIKELKDKIADEKKKLENATGEKAKEINEEIESLTQYKRECEIYFRLKDKHAILAGGTNSIDGFAHGDELIPEAIFRFGGLETLLNKEEFSSMSEKEINDWIDDMIAGTELPTYAELEKNENLSPEEKKKIKEEIDIARERNLHGIDVMMEKFMAYYDRIESTLGVGPVSIETYMANKTLFSSLAENTQVLDNFLLNKSIIGRYGERGERLHRQVRMAASYEILAAGEINNMIYGLNEMQTSENSTNTYESVSEDSKDMTNILKGSLPTPQEELIKYLKDNPLEKADGVFLTDEEQTMIRRDEEYQTIVEKVKEGIAAKQKQFNIESMGKSKEEVDELKSKLIYKPAEAMQKLEQQIGVPQYLSISCESTFGTPEGPELIKRFYRYRLQGTEKLLEEEYQNMNNVLNKFSGGNTNDIVAPPLKEAKRIVSEGTIDEKIALYIVAEIMANCYNPPLSKTGKPLVLNKLQTPRNVKSTPYEKEIDKLKAWFAGIDDPNMAETIAKKFAGFQRGCEKRLVMNLENSKSWKDRREKEVDAQTREKRLEDMAKAYATRDGFLVDKINGVYAATSNSMLLQSIMALNFMCADSYENKEVNDKFKKIISIKNYDQEEIQKKDSKGQPNQSYHDAEMAYHMHLTQINAGSGKIFAKA